MRQRFLFHISEKIGSAGVASLAPTGSTTLTGVVVHAQGAPTGGAGVAGAAIHGRAVQQLRLRNMVGGFGQRACGGVTPAMARLAGGGADCGVIHCHRSGKTTL